MGRIISAWEEGKVGVVDLMNNEPPSILKNFLADMLFRKKSTPYYGGSEYLLDNHKIVLLSEKGSNDYLREFVQVVHDGH